MHAVARLALHPVHHEHPDVVGEDGSGRRRRRASTPGANDLGGTLMNESITRPPARARSGDDAAEDGIDHPVDWPRVPRQRTTLYGEAPEERYAASFASRREAPAIIALRS